MEVPPKERKLFKSSNNLSGWAAKEFYHISKIKATDLLFALFTNSHAGSTGALDSDPGSWYYSAV